MLQDGNGHAFLWQKTTGMVDLGVLPGDDASCAFSINDAGQITGGSQGGPGVEESGVLWESNGEMINIGAGTNYFFSPLSINQQGQIAGTASMNAFIYSRATGVNFVAVPGINAGSIYALNDQGAMVISDPSNANLFYVTPTGTLLSINGGPHKYTNDGGVLMNEQGTVAGYLGTDTDLLHAYTWNAATGLTDLTPGDNDSSWAFGINNLGEAVGGASLDGGPVFPFLYENGNLIDITTMLDASGAGWSNLDLKAINDNGQITGYGTFDGQTEAFLLSPSQSSPNFATPEPTSASLLLLGTTLLLRKNRRVVGI